VRLIYQGSGLTPTEYTWQMRVWHVGISRVWAKPRRIYVTEEVLRCRYIKGYSRRIYYKGYRVMVFITSYIRYVYITSYSLYNCLYPVINKKFFNCWGVLSVGISHPPFYFNVWPTFCQAQYEGVREDTLTPVHNYKGS